MGTIETTLNAVGDTRRRLSRRDLKGLSDIGREFEGAFLTAWRPIELRRRREVVRALVELAEENVEFDFRDVFTACLGDEDATVRQAAIEGLWEDDRPRTMRQVLVMLADDPDSSVRAAAALLLGNFAYMATLDKLRPDDAAQLRAALLRVAVDLDVDIDVRRRAVESVGYFHGADITDAIGTAYASGNVPLKASALAAIGHSLDERWLPVLRAELGSAEPACQYEAAHATGEFGETAAALVPLLLPLVEGDDVEIYSAAIWSLGQIGGDAAKRTLRRLAKDDDPARQEAATEAMAELEFNFDPTRLV